MNFPIYYFPLLNQTCDALYTLKYCEIESDIMRNRAIENDIFTKMLRSKMYWAILSDVELDLSDIQAFVANPSAGHKNIRCAYDAANNSTYGDRRDSDIGLRYLPSHIVKVDKLASLY